MQHLHIQFLFENLESNGQVAYALAYLATRFKLPLNCFLRRIVHCFIRRISDHDQVIINNLLYLN